MSDFFMAVVEEGVGMREGTPLGARSRVRNACSGSDGMFRAGFWPPAMCSAKEVFLDCTVDFPLAGIHQRVMQPSWRF
jgi:hypothetical protein